MEKVLKILRRKIGSGNPVFIVAEISGNHNQNFARAKQLVEAACNAGADAIKLQTYTPDTITIDSSKRWFRVQTKNSWKGKTLYELYKEAYTPWEWHKGLKEIADRKKIPLFSSPFDSTAVDFLEELRVPAYKVASFELVDTELLKKIASTKKPVIISRGMASLKEISMAISVLKKYGAPSVAILHCVSSYPAKIEDMNLAIIQDLRERFKVPVGLSDHSLGIKAAIASVALGASIIEKHFTLKRSDGGPDSAFSLEAQEFKELVDSVREVERAIGKVNYDLSDQEKENIKYRRSLFAVQNIKNGEIFTEKNIRSIRPGYGLLPKYFPKILGKKSKKDISKGDPLLWDAVKIK